MPVSLAHFFRWLPPLAWMLLIFLASADADSGPRGARILGPLLHWLFPDLSASATDAVLLATRKLIHLLAFGTLAILHDRALQPRPLPQRWMPARTRLAFALTVAYAALDEFHQSRVPSRVGSLSDVLIDSFGAAVALVGLSRHRAARRNRIVPQGSGPVAS